MSHRLSRFSLLALLIVWLAIAAPGAGSGAPGGPAPPAAGPFDPGLTFSTYLGGQASERVETTDGPPALAVAVDRSGFTYLAGATDSLDFPATPDALFPLPRGGGDAFLARFDPAGRLDHATYLGGSGRDAAAAVAVDGSGLVWVAGFTDSADFPTSADAFSSTPAGGSDAFLAALDMESGRLVYSTYLGGGGEDAASALETAKSGRVCVAGWTSSTDFPLSGTAWDTILDGDSDVFASCFVDRALAWSTLAGGPGRERAAALAGAADGGLWVAASTQGGVGITPGAPAGAGSWDAWLLRLSADGQSLEYSASFGGSEDDFAGGLSPAAGGGVWLAGATASRDLPTTPGALSTGHRGGEWDWFLARLDPGGGVWSPVSYLGGVGDDGSAQTPPTLAPDIRGNLHLFSLSDGIGFPTTPDALAREPSSPGAADAAYVRVNRAGSLLYSTYLGGSAAELGLSVVATNRAAARLAGLTNSADFPVEAAHQPSLSGSWDAFLAGLDRPLDSLLLFASERIDLKEGVTILRGDAAVNEPGGGIDLESGASAPAGFRLSADVIRLKEGAHASANLFFNQLDDRSGQPTGTQVPRLILPLLEQLPEFEPPQSTSGPDVNVPDDVTMTLSPGSWGHVIVGQMGVLRLAQGEYDLLGVTLQKGAALLATGPVRLRVAGRLKSASDARIGPAGPGVTAADLLLFVAGTPDDFGWSADLGSANVLAANIYAWPAGLHLGKGTQAEGSFFARRIQVELDCSLTLDSAWADPLPANRPPDAGDDAFELNEDEVALLPVLFNDSDPDGDVPVVTSFHEPEHGSLALDRDGGLSYLPDADYFGPDRFDYQVGDGRGGFAWATVLLTVVPVNDPPVARDDTAEGDEDAPLAVVVLENDTDVEGDALTVVSAGPAAHGSVARQDDGAVGYLPDPDFFGSDSFPYTISDGNGGTASAAVHLTIHPVNDAPVAVTDNVATDEDTPLLIDPLSNDLDADGDALVLEGFSNPAHGAVEASGSGLLLYRPAADYFGSDGFSYTVGDGQASSSGTVLITVLPANDPPRVMVQATPLSGTAPLTVQFQAAASDPDGDALVYSWDFGDGATGGDSPTQSHTYSAVGLFTAAVTVSDGAVGDSAELMIEVMSGLPPDPALTAPPLNRTVSATIGAATAFLYSGPNPVQTGVAPGTIVPARAAVLRGRVLDRMDNPLPGVTVSIAGKPEFGRTLSRADGRYDLAVNGGGLLTLDFRKAGFLSAQRQVEAPRQDYREVSDLVLVQPDSEMTVIDLSGPGLHVHRANPVTDQDGARQATIFFPPGTAAEMLLPDGSVQPITTLSVRATEFTVGANGPRAMPAELPPTSAYTYAVALTVDEALAAGAGGVRFSQPVPLYIENFLDFPVGIDVPLGNYDPEAGRWVASDNGRIVEVLAVTGGRAELDVDGSGTPASAAALAALGVGDAELEGLAQFYAAGQRLWRAPLPHFSNWDANWGIFPPLDAIAPLIRVLLRRLLDTTCEECGTIVEIENQVLGERIGLAGTSFSLNHRSDRTPGWRAGNTLDVQLSGDAIPASLRRIDLEVGVAGRIHRQSFPATPNQIATFTWDGRDVYGRVLQGRQPVQVRVGYVYDSMYGIPNRFGYNGNGQVIEAGNSRDELVFWSVERAVLGTWDAEAEGLGGWTLDAHHRFDVAGRTLYLGDGGRRTAESLSVVIDTVVSQSVSTISGARDIDLLPDGSLLIAEGGGRVRRMAPDGSFSTVVAGFTGVSSVAARADGTIFLSDSGGNRVWAVSPDGALSVAAGTGEVGYSGDGGPATSARLAQPQGIAVAPDGALYITEFNNHVLRRVSTDGIISTVAGTGQFGSDGDGGPARLARLRGPTDVSVGPDGSLYVADNQAAKIRRIALDGTITTVAGTGGFGGFQDGIPATEARLFSPGGVEVDAEGRILIAEALPDQDRIRIVSRDGFIFTHAGVGLRGFQGDGGPVLRARLNQPRGMVAAPDGSLYFADSGSARVRRTFPAFPGFEGTALSIPSEDGTLVYHFDAAGRHLRTEQATTGATLFTFQYDSQGRLAEIADGDGNLTRIEREPSGVATAIVSPFGRRTELSVGSAGRLESLLTPSGAGAAFGYSPEGQLTSLRDPRGNTSSYQYNAEGRLESWTNTLGGVSVLTRTELPDGFSVTRTDPEGRIETHTVQRLPGGVVRRTGSRPGGNSSETVAGPDGSYAVTRSDDTGTQIQVESDPRFGVVSFVSESRTDTRPSGAALVQSRERVPEADGDSSRRVTLDGQTYTSSFDLQTSTLTDTTPEGRVSVTRLDPQGRIAEETITGFFAFRYEYDVFGRLRVIRQGSGAEERTIQIAYNALGLPVGLTNSLGDTIHFEFDPDGRVTRQGLPDGSSIHFAYDGNGNPVSVTPPGRPPHLLEYTAADRQSRHTPPTPATGSTVFRYDRGGLPVEIVRADGRTVVIQHNDAGQVSSMTMPSGAIDFQFDAVTGNLTGIGAPQGQDLEFAYDGALPIRTGWIGPVSGSVRRTHDALGRVTSRQVNSEPAVTFEYDRDSLLTRAGSLILERAPANGLVNRITLDSVTEDWACNGFGEVTSQLAAAGGQALFSMQIERDPLGRIARKTEAVLGSPRTTSYEYDSLGRLARVSRGEAVAAEYEYDANGNRTALRRDGQTVTATYDDQDRLLQSGGIQYTHSANGERTGKLEGGLETQYAYDALGNLLGVRLPDGRHIEYLLDGRLRRVGKRIDGVLVQAFLYQDDLNPIAELDGSGNVVAEFVYGTRPNVPDYLFKGGQAYRILADQLGSPRLVVEASTGNVVQRLEYDEFGELLSDSAPGFQPFGFAGGLYDRDTGLIAFGRRSYDPVAGRWLSRDPIGFSGGSTNLYSYCLNDPVNFLDPSGLQQVGSPGAGGSPYSSFEDDLRRIAEEQARANARLRESLAGYVPEFLLDTYLPTNPEDVPVLKIGVICSLPPSLRGLFGGRFPLKPGAGGRLQPFNPANGRYLSFSANQSALSRGWCAARGAVTRSVSFPGVKEFGGGLGEGIIRGLTPGAPPGAPRPTAAGRWGQIIGEFIGNLWPK